MATSQQQVPQGNSVLVARYDTAVDKIAETTWNLNHKRSCNLQRARKYIGTKRQATWGWQAKLLMPQTPTRYNERHVHGCGYLKWSGKRWAGLAHKHFRKYVALQEPENAICYVFGKYCHQPLNVSRCESGHSYSINAHNGQYLGMFQMGSYARSLYGHGNTPLIQAVAAYRYFVASGKDWSPWSCSPY